MADFKFTQTGAQIQALLNKVANLPQVYKHTVNVGNPSTSTTIFRFYSKNQSQITSVSDILTVDFICFNYLSVGTGTGSIKGQILAVYMDSSNICIKYIDATGTLTQVTMEFTYLVDTVTQVL